MMKGKLKKAVALVTALSCVQISPLAVTEVEAAQDAVSATKSGNIVTIGNDKLSREFSISDDRLSTTKIENLLGNSVFTPGENSEEFVIKTLDETSNGAVSLEEYTTSEGNSSQILDGITDTTGNFWCSNSDDMKLVVNFGSEKEVKKVVYTPRYDNSAKYNCTGRLTKLKIQYWDGSAWQDATVGGNAEISLTTDANTKPDAIELDETVTTSKIKLVGIESYHWQDANRNKFMNVGELDVQDTAGTTVLDKGTQIAGKEIKSSELTLKSTSIDDTTAVINDVNKTGKMITFEFDPVQMGTGEANITEKIVMYDGDHFMRKFLEIDSEDKDVRMDYIDGEHLTVTDSDKTWTVPKGVGGVVEMSEYKANLGQPIYIDGMFVGSEFPETDTQIESGLGHVRYYTGKNFTDFERDGQLTEDGKYISWQTVVGASHSDGSDQGVIQSDFYDYIDSIATPSDFRLQYNSWFDNMMRIDDDNILSSFIEIEKELTQTGVRPMDSYVVDDGWNNYNDTSVVDSVRSGTTLNTTGFWEFNSKFPNGLTTSSSLVNKLGSDFGVWIGPRGGYNFFGSLADILTKSGTGSKSGGSIDVADATYVQKFEEMAINWMHDYGVNYWKWDGFADVAQYNAFPSGEGVVGYSEEHRHMYGGQNQMYHVTDLWEKWIVLMENIRQAEKDYNIKNLWISLTCYVNPSPWFLQWANSVWLQCAGDRGEISNGTLNNKMDNMLTYRDANYYEFVQVHQFQFPLANLYNHDPIYGSEGTGIVADSMTAEQFKNYLYMMGTRGTAFWELYYSDSLLDKDKYLVNAEFLEWEEENFSKLKNAKMIGSHPSSATRLSTYRNGGMSSGEVQNPYGFACFDGNAGIISMRNPSATEKTITFTLNDAIGVTKAGTYHMSTVHTYSPNGTIATAKDTYTKGEEVSVTLQPGEVQVWSLSQDADTTAPTFKSLTSVSGTELRVQLSEKIKGNAILKVKVNNEVVDNVTVSEYADLRTFKLTFATALNDGDVVEVSAESGADAAGNQITGKISAPYYAENKIAEKETVEGSNSEISGKDRSVEGTNGFTVAAQVQTADRSVVLVKQGDAYELGINAEGHPYFTVNGVTATADAVISDATESMIVGVKENNGLVRIYVDGQISASVYNAENKEFAVPAAKIVGNGVNGAVTNVAVYDRSLGYDEVPTSGLAETVKKITAEKNNWTTESWTAANMDTLLSNATSAISGGDASAIQAAKEALTAGYATLVPKVVENLAYQKNVTAAWVDANETTDMTNTRSPLSKAVDGLNNDSDSYAIYGKDGKDKGSYITIDLGQQCRINNVNLWRYWTDGRTYKATALVVSDTADFAKKTVLYYSGDSDVYNLGVDPTDTLYAETSAGKALYSGEAVTGRYVRLYAMGKVGSNTTSGHENHIVEIQINGRAADADPYDLTEYRKVLKEAKTEAAKDIYTAESVAALNEQITASEALITELDAAINAGNQPDKSWSEVANAKAALEAAVAALAKNDGPVVEEDADYTAVNAAKEKAAGVDRSRYTDESLKALDDAVAAVVEGLKKSEQSRVDAMAAAINNAYAALVEKDADYTAVNAAKEKAAGVDRSRYTDESLKALDDAVAAVVEGLKKSEQSRVDAMAAAINNAYAALVEKDADYTAVNAAKEKAAGVDRSRYTDESLKALDDAVAAVVEGLKKSEQSRVDAMAAAINNAYVALVEKPAVEEDADYTAVNAAIAKADKIDRSKYTEESLKALDDAIAAVEKGLKESEQSRVDAMAAAIEKALSELVESPVVEPEKDADYTTVNAAMEKVQKIDRSKYTEESLKALDDAVAAVEKGLKESEQDKVDAMAAAIEKALDGLKKKPAADDDKKNDSKKDDSNKNDLNKNDSDKKADAVKTTTVKTGDAANVIPFFGMTLLAAGAVIVIAFKKKRRA